MRPSGIEPATFRFVAQHLNHCATVVPMYLHNTVCYFVKYEVHIVMVIKIIFFGDVPLSQLMCMYQCYGGTCCF